FFRGVQKLDADDAECADETQMRRALKDFVKRSPRSFAVSVFICLICVHLRPAFRYLGGPEQQILRGVYPERMRRAQDDTSASSRDSANDVFWRSALGPQLSDDFTAGIPNRPV